MTDNTLDNPVQMYKATFKHIYFSNGFAVSKQVIGIEYRPETTHKCMECGYWCKDQIKEDGEIAIVRYLKRKGVRNPKTVVKAIRRLK